MFFILFYNNKVYNKMSTKTKLIQERPGVQAVVVSVDEGGNVQSFEPFSQSMRHEKEETFSLNSTIFSSIIVMKYEKR